MQRFTLIAALAASASAYQVKINNNCGETAYIWSCGDTVGEMHTLEPGGAPWTEPYYSKQGGSAGPSIYVSQTNSYKDGNIAQLEYFWDGKQVWFDLSLINGRAFGEGGIVLKSSIENPPYDACKAVTCPPSAGPCNMAYNTHEQLPGTHDCPGSDLIMDLCPNGGSGSSGGGGSGKPAPSQKPQPSPQPAPSPSPSPAPSPSPEPSSAPAPTQAPPAPSPSPSSDDHGAGFKQSDSPKPQPHTVYATTIVTQVVSVKPGPSGAVPYVEADGSVHEKREQHLHAHQARAHNHAGRRHGHQ